MGKTLPQVRPNFRSHKKNIETSTLSLKRSVYEKDFLQHDAGTGRTDGAGTGTKSQFSKKSSTCQTHRGVANAFGRHADGMEATE